MGIATSMEQQDKYLIALAHVKQAVARAEHKLAHRRTKEMKLLHRLQRIREELAEKRMMQAEIDIERVKNYQKCRKEKPRLVGSPLEILTTVAVHLALWHNCTTNSRARRSSGPPKKGRKRCCFPRLAVSVGRRRSMNRITSVEVCA